MAVRDQIISEQRDMVGQLWRIMEAAGLDQARIMDIARQEGIMLDEHQGLEGGAGGGPGEPCSPGVMSPMAKIARVLASAEGDLNKSMVFGRAGYRWASAGEERVGAGSMCLYAVCRVSLRGAGLLLTC